MQSRDFMDAWLDERGIGRATHPSEEEGQVAKKIVDNRSVYMTSMRRIDEDLMKEGDRGFLSHHATTP